MNGIQLSKNYLKIDRITGYGNEWKLARLQKAQSSRRKMEGVFELRFFRLSPLKM